MNGDSVGKLFTTNGRDVWRCVSYCQYPTIRFENIETKQVVGGAVGCLNVKDFMPLIAATQPPKDKP